MQAKQKAWILRRLVSVKTFYLISFFLRRRVAILKIEKNNRGTTRHSFCRSTFLPNGNEGIKMTSETLIALTHSLHSDIKPQLTYALNGKRADRKVLWRVFKRIQHMSIRNKLFSNLILKISLFQETRLISIYKRNFPKCERGSKVVTLYSSGKKKSLYEAWEHINDPFTQLPGEKKKTFKEANEVRLLLTDSRYEIHAISLAMWRDLINVSGSIAARFCFASRHLVSRHPFSVVKKTRSTKPETQTHWNIQRQSMFSLISGNIWPRHVHVVTLILRDEANERLRRRLINEMPIPDSCLRCMKFVIVKMICSCFTAECLKNNSNMLQ